MTRLTKFLAVAAATFGAIASNGAMAAGNLQLNYPTGQTTCATYSTLSVAPSGDVVVTCASTGTVDPGQPGTISLSTTKYTAAKTSSTVSANATVSVVRNGGSAGQVDATLTVSGTGCTLAFNAIQFPTGDASAKNVNLSSANAGTNVCTVTLALAATSVGTLVAPSTATLDVTDNTVVTPPPPGCPATAANVTMGTLLTSAAAGRVVDKARTDGLPPTIYSYPLPKNVSGGFFTTRDPDTPPSMNVQVSISKCPGDFDTAKTDSTEVFFYPWFASVKYYPCLAQGSAESGSLWWGSTLGQNTCKTDTTVQYYANIRITDENGNYSCPVASANGPGCPLRFWWN